MNYVIKVEVSSKALPGDDARKTWFEEWDLTYNEAPGLKDITEDANSIILAFNIGVPEEEQRSLVRIHSVGIPKGGSFKLTDEDMPVAVVKEEDTEVKLQRSVSELVELREYLEEESGSAEVEAVSKTLDWLFDPERSVDIEELKDFVQ